MHARPTSIVYAILFILSLSVAACDQPSSGSNKITVTPAPVVDSQSAGDPALALDKSPMDMSYLPAEYPKIKMSGRITEPLVARIIYSRPQKDGRIIFGNVVQYGQSWRLGANEATEIEFFRGVTIRNRNIRPGRYILYCIPYPDKWTVIINSDLFTWGLKIDSTKDLYHFDVPVAKTNYPFEVFTMFFEQADKGANLVMEWDSVRVKLPIEYSRLQQEPSR